MKLMLIIPWLQAWKLALTFAFLAALMETWEIKLPRLTKIFPADAAYIASLFLFPIRQTLFLILFGTVFKIIYFRKISSGDIFRLARLQIVFFFSGRLFSSLHLRPFYNMFPWLVRYNTWVIYYTILQFLLMQWETMAQRKATRISADWRGFFHFLAFNIFLFAPFGPFLYFLYKLSPQPIPYGSIAVVPVLWSIYLLTRHYSKHLEAAKITIEALAIAHDKKLVFTESHSHRVAELAEKIAIAMEMSEEDVAIIGSAARIHNLGNIGVPDQTLRKKERLEEQEQEQIRQHPQIGAKIAGNLSIYERGVEIILSHHEHYDGTGYPNGLKGEEIPLGARIIAAADAFVAMISERPYRQAMPAGEAVRQIQASGKKELDPNVVDALVKIVS